MSMEPMLYAKADGNRKPWYIVSIESGISTGEPKRDFRICHNDDERSAAVAEFRKLYSLNDCQVYVAEGFWNIQG